MLRSYFSVALRNFSRNKLVSVINIGGLTLGLTIGIIICLYVVYVFGFDKFHANYRDIHVVEMNETFAGSIHTGGATPSPLGPALQRNIPALKYVARVREEGEALTQYAEQALYQKSIYAEPDFFHLMTFPAVEGDPVSTLRNGGGVILTEQAARRLFGRGPALGKTILLNNTHPLTVGAVIRDIPVNSSIQFDVALPFGIFEKDNAWADSWDFRTVQTWLQLQPGANLEVLNAEMTRMLSENTHLKETSAFAYPIARLHLYDNFKNGKPYWGKAYLILAIALIAFLTLTIACINFMNLSTAMAERRAREVGVRKVLGASRSILIGQFLGEAVLLSMVALALSIGLAYLVLPWFTAFAEYPLIDQFGEPRVWALLVVLGLVTGLMAGSYPALYLSRFQPVKVLKRLMSIGVKGARLRKALVAFQFVISIFLVIITIVVDKQVHYMVERPLGYETSNLIDIVADGDLPGRFDLFKAKLKDIPGIVSQTASTSNLITVGDTQTGLRWPGKRPDEDLLFRAAWVGFDWTKTTGLTLAEGRDFSPEFGADSLACLINQTAARKMGLKTPVVGTVVNGKRVIGVLQDFVFDYTPKAIQPLIVYLGKKDMHHFLVRLTNDGQWKAHLSQIEKAARSLNPGYPFTFRFTDEEHQQEFKNDYGVERLSNIFSVLAILISCMGLFGLASFLVERRSKEMSIRKVLGASPGRIWISLSVEMLKPVFLSLLVAIPLAAIASSAILTAAEYHITLTWWTFAMAIVGAVLIALATVSYHGTRAARINPVNALRSE